MRHAGPERYVYVHNLLHPMGSARNNVSGEVVMPIAGVEFPNAS